MRPTLLIGLILTAFMIAPSSAFADTDRRLDGGEVLLFTHDVDGQSIPKVNVYGVVDAPPEDIWAIISDCDKYVGVLPRVDKAKIVSRSGSTVTCDVTLGLPFPISDLRAVTEAEHTTGPPSWKREWTLVEGDYEVNEGHWTLTRFQGDESRTLVVYSLNAVPKNRVPNRVQRRAQEGSMQDIIKSLREHTAK